MRSLVVVLLLLGAGCGDGGSRVDLATGTDLASADQAVVDLRLPDQSATGDLATASDLASTIDSGAGADGGACHAIGFGAAAVPFTTGATLPMMTGGSIPFGIYDAVAATTSGSTTGTYRATWLFETSQLYSIEQLDLGSTPPTPTPRTLSWSTSGTTLSRAQTCGGSASFSNEYRVRVEAGGTFLDVRQNTIMFTFAKR